MADDPKERPANGRVDTSIEAWQRAIPAASSLGLPRLHWNGRAVVGDKPEAPQSSGAKERG